jgi:two-component system, cell cycle response regulator DivK
MTSIPYSLVGWTVLVVDDEPDSLELAQLLLEMAGAKVITVSNGKAALDAVKLHRPQFILSDISMPEMDGWQLIEALKRERPTLEIPVVALTAHAMPGDREKAIQAGFVNHITKPLDPNKFIFQLINLLIDVPQFSSLLQKE